jgi:hypothetical protein
LLIAFVASVALYLWSLFSQVRQGAYLNMPAFLFWLVSILFFVPFALPLGNFDVCWILPSLMHWWQYIGLNYVIVKFKYTSEEETQYLPANRPVLVFAAVCGVVLLLQFGSYCFFNHEFPQKQYMSIWSSFFLGLNMVHYLLDGFIWRFREKHNRDAVLVPLLNARSLKPLPKE